MADNNKKELENQEEQDANHSRQQATEDLLNKLNLNPQPEDFSVVQLNVLVK